MIAPLRRTRRDWRAIALCLSATVVVSGCGAGRDAVDTGSAGQYRFVTATDRGTVIPLAARKPAANLTGSLISGGSYSLAAHRGRVVLINYWASWCAPCVIESPMLDTVYRSLHGRGVDFVGIDIKDERQAAESFIADKHMSYPMIFDETAKTAIQLSIPSGGLPVTVLVDRAGRIAAVYLGLVQQADMTRTLQGLASEAA